MPQQPQRKPGGRPATPPPGYNVTSRIDVLEDRMGSIEQTNGQILSVLRELAGKIDSRESHVPHFQPSVQPMTEDEAEAFKEQVTHTVQRTHSEDVRREKNEIDRLMRERKVLITIDEADAFIHGGERWIFNQVGHTFKVPETIGRLFMQRRRAKLDVMRREHSIQQTLASQQIPLDTMEHSLETMLGHGQQQRGGRTRGLIERA